MLGRIMYSALWLLVLAGIGYLGYFGYTRLSHDFVYESESARGGDDVIAIEFGEGETPAVTPDTEAETSETPAAETPASASGESLADVNPELVRRLNNLVTDVIQMRVGSSGTRVGTVQEFLNLYNDEDIAVDNGYGPGTKAAVEAFQRAEGLDADGLAGPNTYRAMLEWLDEN